MLKIRFFRTGKKHQPSFKIVVTDRRNPPRGGRFLEEVGFWSPLTKEKIVKGERIKYWISKGAKPSDSVYNLLIREKVLGGKKISVHKKKKKGKESSKETTSGSKKEVSAALTDGEDKKTEEVNLREPKEETIKPEKEDRSGVVKAEGEEKPASTPEEISGEEKNKNEDKGAAKELEEEKKEENVKEKTEKKPEEKEKEEKAEEIN